MTKRDQVIQHIAHSIFKLSERWPVVDGEIQHDKGYLVHLRGKAFDHAFTEAVNTNIGWMDLVVEKASQSPRAWALLKNDVKTKYDRDVTLYSPVRWEDGT